MGSGSKTRSLVGGAEKQTEWEWKVGSKCEEFLFHSHHSLPRRQVPSPAPSHSSEGPRRCLQPGHRALAGHRPPARGHLLTPTQAGAHRGPMNRGRSAWICADPSLRPLCPAGRWCWVKPGATYSPRRLRAGCLGGHTQSHTSTMAVDTCVRTNKRVSEMQRRRAAWKGACEQTRSPPATPRCASVRPLGSHAAPCACLRAGCTHIPSACCTGV